MSQITKDSVERTLVDLRTRIQLFKGIQEKLFAELDGTSALIDKTLEDLKTLVPPRTRTSLSHVPTAFKTIVRGRFRGRISKVTCKCGEETEYKIPLQDIDQFECPKKNKKRRK